MFKVVGLQVATLLCLGLIFIGLQRPSVYKHTLGLIADTWQNENGERTLVNEPYEALTQDNYIQWDAAHYFQIKRSGYDSNSADGDHIFAFFPLFPALLKISNLPPVGVLFLNYIFFSTALLILLTCFSEPENYLRNSLLSLSLPSIIIFLIPYSEATFILLCSIGIYGFVKKKYWIFFAGMFLASLTRPSYTFLFLSFISVEIFFLIQHRNLKETVKNTVLRLLPLLAGTATVSLIQYTQGSGRLLKFIEVQKNWKNVLAVPHFLKDWSHEGFAINIGVVFLIFFPLFMILLQVFYKQLKNRIALNYHSYIDYLLILSSIYLIGNVLFILLYRGGSLHCLFRFTLCSPFFYILLYTAYNYIRYIPISYRFFFFSTFSLAGIFVVGLSDYSGLWNFSDVGIFVLIGVLLFWLFQDFQQRSLYKISILLLWLSNMVWTTYLFHTYLINGWIFA